MNKATIFAITACLFLLNIGQAQSETRNQAGYDYSDYEIDTAQDLLDICGVDVDNKDYAEARNFCFGFFAGGKAYHDAIMIADEMLPIFCPPPGTTRADAVDVFVSYAQAHPEYMGEPPIETVARALVEEWPCKPGQQ